MITSYKQLTGKYLKSNKKRTLLTIIGIVLSVALISSIGLFIKGIQLAEIQDMKNGYGSFHLLFKKANADLVSKVANNPRVSRSGLFTEGNEIKIGEKLTVHEMIASDRALELLPYKIKEGKLPENGNEVAVEKWALRFIDKDAGIGSKIMVGGKTYTLSGVLEDNYQNQMEGKGILLSKSNSINGENALLLVEISSRTNLNTALKELKQLGTKDTVFENAYLLGVLGAGESAKGMQGLYMVVGVIIGIVVIATIAVIYNAFQISVVERIKQFGLLRAVGTTPRQIRKIVLREATILAAIGVPVGLLFGVVAIYAIDIAFRLIGGNSIVYMKPSVSPEILAAGAFVGTVSIYLSALLPAFFAGRISPLVAISSRTAITKEKIKRRKSVIIGKILGFEGTMAVKNIKRNRKRYRITIFSIAISVVLFVAFKSFMDMTLRVSSDLNESQNVHFSVVRYGQADRDNATINDKIMEKVSALEPVEKVYKVYKPYSLQAVVDRKSEIKEVQNIGKANGGLYNKIKFEGQDKTRMNAWIGIYDTNAIEVSKKYLESGSLNIKKMNSENGVIIINKNRIYNDDTHKSYYGPVADIKVGDEIALQYDENPEQRTEFGKGEVKKVKVMAILKNEPFNFRGGQDGLKIITTGEMAAKLTGKATPGPINLNIAIKDVKSEERAKVEIEDVLKTDPSLQLVNNIDSSRKQKSTILMVQILVYGFVIVVSLIGSVNIINTLTTNIILRKREFASLKSIGLTQKGLKKMIVLEGFMYGIAGAVYGSIIGCGLSYVMFTGLSSVRELGWRVPWNAIAIAAVCAMIIGYVSVLSPLSRIKKENLIEAIRDEY